MEANRLCVCFFEPSPFLTCVCLTGEFICVSGRFVYSTVPLLCAWARGAQGAPIVVPLDEGAISKEMYEFGVQTSSGPSPAHVAPSYECCSTAGPTAFNGLFSVCLGSTHSSFFPIRLLPFPEEYLIICCEGGNGMKDRPTPAVLPPSDGKRSYSTECLLLHIAFDWPAGKPSRCKHQQHTQTHRKTHIERSMMIKIKHTHRHTNLLRGSPNGSG